MTAHAESLVAEQPRWLAPFAIALGCLSLVARSVTYESIAATAIVGVLGLVVHVGVGSRAQGRLRWLLVVAVGIVAFFAGRELGSGIGVRLTGLGVLSIVLAAVAEEAFFRRLVYGWLERWGAAIAVGVSALLFALIHLPTYGPDVLWIDLAAGGVLGWQRWAAGTWTAPAATHVVANLLQMG